MEPNEADYDSELSASSSMGHSDRNAESESETEEKSSKKFSLMHHNNECVVTHMKMAPLYENRDQANESIIQAKNITTISLI